VAALNVLKGVSTLHAYDGRLTNAVHRHHLTTFEAAVLLVPLCIDQDVFGEYENHRPSTIKVDPLGAGMVNLKREECIQAVRDALSRLQMLAEVSNIAEVGRKL